MWTIQLLGGLAARNPQREITRFRTQKAASLLGYLAFHAAPGRAARPRETLIGMFWPDAEPEVGRHNLSNALSFLRHVLEPPGIPPGTVILADRTTVRLNPAAVTSDVVAFEEALRRAKASNLPRSERTALLLQAAELYQGPLLPGFYESWIEPELMRLDHLFMQVVGELAMILLEAGTPEPALAFAQRAAAANPFSEEATLTLMQVLTAMNQPSQALRAYRQLETRLREELRTAPAKDLQALAHELRTAAPTVLAPVDTACPTDSRADVEPEAPAPVKPEPVEPKGDRSSTGDRLRGGEFLLRTTTRFFGRTAEIEQLAEMLSTPRTRLVTLTGPGGTGKTRLALEVAAHLVETPRVDGPASAVFVPLADVSDPGRLYDVMLRSIGPPPAPDRELIDQLSVALASQPGMLLILDNFEQLAETGALLVRDLLATAATVKLLVTSRQKLYIEGEHGFPVSPLPTSGQLQSLEALSILPGIALFVDRAQAALPDFQLTERNSASVVQLCDHLEGIPLAIELAAARAGVLAPARMLEQVQANRLDFLATRRRDAYSRQRTLRATLDWSYHLLPEAGRRSLAQLSVFRGGFTLEAAQAVCALGEAETLDMLMLLRDCSLLSVTDTEEGLRFAMLETVREYAAEHLDGSEFRGEVSKRHRDFFLALAEAAEAELSGPQQTTWLDRLESEHENFRAALTRCQSEEDGAKAGLRLAGALGRFWDAHAHLSEGRARIADVLGRSEGVGRTEERAKALCRAGVLAGSQGDYRTATELLEESAAIRRELGDVTGLAESLNELATIARLRGDYQAADVVQRECLEVFRELGDRQGIAKSLHNLGLMALYQGNHSVANALLRESMTIFGELGDQRDFVWTLHHVGIAAYWQSDYETTRKLCGESLEQFRELGDKRGIADALHHLAIVATRQGDSANARRLYEEGLAIRREIGDKLGCAWSLHELANIAVRLGEYESAAASYEESRAKFVELQDKSGVAWSLYELGSLAWEQGDPAAAGKWYEESLARFRELEYRMGIAWSLRRLGDVAEKQGRREEARALIDQSQAALREEGVKGGVVFWLESIGRLSAREGRPESALRLWAAADGLRQRVGLPIPPSQRATRDNDLEMVRSALKEEAFAAVWLEGQALTEDEAVALALGEAMPPDH